MRRLLIGLFLPAFLLAQAAQAQPVRITGRIVPPVSGAVGATVELQSFLDTRAESLRRLAGEAVPPLASARPRADGSFELRAPEPGFYSVVIRADGRLARKSFLTFVVEDVELPPVELPATAPLQVRAVGPDGMPLAGVAIQAISAIRARSRGDEWGADDRRAVTDADGRATFLRAEGEALSLTVTTPGRYGVAQTGPSGAEQAVAFRKPGARVVELRNPDGKPAAGALVRIGNRGWPYGLTGEDGRIALPVPEDGEVVALAEDAKGRRIEIVMTVEAGEGTDVPVVSLRPPTLVTGQVLDAATREPLAGALVWNGGTGWVRSDARGGFELRAPSGDRGRLEAQAPGRLRHRRRWVRDDNQPVTFALDAAGSIAGLVVDEAGRPLAGARALTILNPAARAGELAMNETVAWSGADGRFALRSLPADRLHSVTVSLDGFAPASQPADASSGPPVRFQLGRGATAVGRVVDEAGQPVAGAAAVLTPAALPSVPDVGLGRLQAVSDGEGRFRIPHVSAGSFGLQVRREGFAPAAPGEVTIPGKTAEADLGTITLTPGAVIEGVVVDSRGKPVMGAAVDPESFDARLSIQPVTTGLDGRFRFADLPRGGRFSLWIDHPRFVQLQVHEVEAPTPKPLRIKLATARSLTGQVVDPEGQPVAGAKVALTEGAGGLLLGGGFAEGAWGSSLATTDEDGRFVLDRLPPQTIGIEARAAGFRNRSLKGIEIPEDGEATPVEIQLERGPYLEGRVLDGQGRPVPRALIRAEGKVQDSGRFSFGGTRADDEGHYQIDGLEPGPHTVTAESQEGGPGARAAVEIQAGPNRLDLSLPAGAEVAGRVVDARGLPVAGADVSLLGLPPSTSWGLQAISSADGSFLIQDVPEGVYRLVGQRRGFARSEAPERVEVGGDPVHGLELRLSPGAVLRGKLLGLNPADRDRIEIHVSGESSVALSPAQVDADGSYRIPDLPPGRWTVLVLLSPRGVVAQGTVEVGYGDEEVLLDVEIPAPER